MLNRNTGWHVIKLDDVAPSAWKNGGGQTRELIAFPSMLNWNWRVSVARVTSNGAFSPFPGVQRWLTVLSGEGLRLSAGADLHTLLPDRAPIEFSGDESSHCDLVAGPVQDFNFMVRRPGLGKLTRLRQSQSTKLAASSIFGVYAVDATLLRHTGGELKLRANSLAWKEIADSETCRVETLNALCFEVDLTRAFH